MDNIPKEIYSIIGSFLDNASKRTMRLASTQWFNIIKYDSFNVYNTTEDEFEEICNRLKRYNFPIGVTFSAREFVFEKRHYDMLGQLTQLTQLVNAFSRQEQVPLEDLWALTNLTNLEIINDVQKYGSDYPPAITAHLPNLKSVQITSKEHVQVSKTLSKLESIAYHMGEYPILQYIQEDLQVVPDLLKLTKLSIVGQASEQKFDRANEYLTKLSNLKEFLVMDRSWFDADELNNTWNVPTLPNLEVIMMHGQANIQSISLSNTKLTHLRLNSENINCTNFNPFTNLEDLFLDGKITNLSGLRSLKKMKKLTLTFADRSEDVADFEFLSHLPNLEVFDITSSTGGKKWSELVKYFSEDNNLMEIRFDGSNDCVGSHATKFQKLESFCCDKIDAASAYHLTALTNLTNLYITKMSPEIFASLTGLTTLKSLACYIDSAALEIPNLTSSLLSFGKFLNLETLTVRQEIGDLVFSGFHELTRLTSLTVHLPTAEPIFAEISQCTSLVELQLELNISDDQIVKLTNLTNLRKLNLVPSGEFTGVNLTCLTSLRSLDIYCPSLVVTSTTLRQKLPNLRACAMN